MNQLCPSPLHRNVCCLPCWPVQCDGCVATNSWDPKPLSLNGSSNTLNRQHQDRAASKSFLETSGDWYLGIQFNLLDPPGQNLVTLTQDHGRIAMVASCRFYTSFPPLLPSIQQGFYSFPFFRGQLSIFNGLYEDVQQIFLMATRNSCCEVQLCSCNKIKPKTRVDLWTSGTKKHRRIDKWHADKHHFLQFGLHLTQKLNGLWPYLLHQFCVPQHQAGSSFDFPSQSPPKQKESKIKSMKVYARKKPLPWILIIEKHHINTIS